VIDTAPTGHTLLLLDGTGAFHRQVMHDATLNHGRITTPLMRLQDPTFSRLVLVALPETTPVAEAAELQADLRRAGIEPFGWVLNAVLAGTGTADPVLAARARLEQAQLARVAELANRVWLAPFDPTLDHHAEANRRGSGPARLTTRPAWLPARSRVQAVGQFVGERDRDVGEPCVTQAGLVLRHRQLPE
jgi:arsenite-transporting ATPase